MEDFIEIGCSYHKSLDKTIKIDKLVMYLIVRESLNMSIGKTAAQVAHAAQKLQAEYQNLINKAESYLPYLHNCSAEDFSKIPRELLDRIEIFEKWFDNSAAKIVLKANEKEWLQLKEEFKDSMVLIIDAGLTELTPNTETVMGLWPTYKFQISKSVKKLQTLK